MGYLKLAAVAGAVLAGTAALLIATRKKPEGEGAAAEEKAPAWQPEENAKGEYSFIGGYTNAKSSYVRFDYDKAVFSFSVPEDFSLNDTNVSHVAILNAEKLDVQIEYAEFYPGDSMPELRKSVTEKYNAFEDLRFGENSFMKFIDGDAVCLCTSVSGNPECYIVISVFKAKDNDDKLEALLDYPALSHVLSSLTSFTVE